MFSSLVLCIDSTDEFSDVVMGGLQQSKRISYYWWYQWQKKQFFEASKMGIFLMILLEQFMSHARGFKSIKMWIFLRYSLPMVTRTWTYKSQRCQNPLTRYSTPAIKACCTWLCDIIGRRCSCGVKINKKFFSSSVIFIMQRQHPSETQTW